MAQEAPQGAMAQEAPQAAMAQEAPQAAMAQEAPQAAMAQEAPQAAMAQEAPQAAMAQEAPQAALVHAAPDRPPPPRRAAQELSYGALPEVLGYHLRRAQVALFRHYARSVAAQTGLTPGLLGMLQVIAANPGLAQSRLAEAMGVDRSTIVKVVDQLEAHGLIVREPSPSDRRSHCLRLTAAGAAGLPRMQRLMRQHEDEFAQPLSADERRTLIALLARLHERFEGGFDPAACQRG